MPQETEDQQKDRALVQSKKSLASRMRKALMGMIALVLFAFFVLLTGWVMFTGYVLMASESEPEASDAIVVVTGGAGRLERAIELLRENKGKKLLISGVHYQNSDHTLIARFDLSEKEINCCVDIDREALNTVANATQTALWADRNNFSSLIIVTSAYHMPRTMLEMRRAAPHITFHGDVVAVPNPESWLVRLTDWNNLTLLSKEYGKLLAAIVHGTTERLLSKRTHQHL